MVIKVFCAEISSNTRVKSRQEHVKRILEIRGIPFESVDITSEENAKEKEFMASNATKRRGSSSNVALAPQIFNDDVYCGDYEDFDEANEAGTLLQFLKLDESTTDSNSSAVEQETTKEESNEPRIVDVEAVPAGGE